MRDYLEELLRALAAEEETEETPARWQTEVEFPPAEGRAPEQESEALADILEAAGSAAAVSLWGELPEPSPLLPPLLDQGGQSLEESWNSGDREQAEWFPGDGARLSSRFPLLSLERDSLSLSALEQENDRRRPALLEQLRVLERAAAPAVQKEQQPGRCPCPLRSQERSAGPFGPSRAGGPLLGRGAGKPAGRYRPGSGGGPGLSAGQPAV